MGRVIDWIGRWQLAHGTYFADDPDPCMRGDHTTTRGPRGLFCRVCGLDLPLPEVSRETKLSGPDSTRNPTDTLEP